MANSEIISRLKDAAIMAIISDEDIYHAIMNHKIGELVDEDISYPSPAHVEISCGEDLVGTHIFRFRQNPTVIETPMTFICVMAHTDYKDYNKTYVNATLEFWIYTHNAYMNINNNDLFPNINDNRNDYISRILDKKFNKSTDFGGLRKMDLILNTEDSYNDEWLYRHMVFRTVDLNDSFCGGR